MELSKKVAYLKGLMEGLKIDDSTNEGKILTIMADILDEMSATVEDIAEEVDETVELVDTLDEDLGEIEELIYGDDDDDDDEHEHHHHEGCCHHDHEEHDHHHDHDEHEHHHHHDGECDDPECSCHHHHHHADEVFTSWGAETVHSYTEEDIRRILTALDTGDYGAILRAKGIVPSGGKWLHFDYVPEEQDVRYGSADYTGRLCVIGAQLKEDKLKELFSL